MFSFQYYCGPVLLSIEDVVSSSRDAAKQLAESLVDAEARLRGANRVTLHEDGQPIWEYRAN